MTLDKFTVGEINGNNNKVYNGNTTIIETIKPKESIMFKVLNDIANMVADVKITPILPDGITYTIPDKIAYNQIDIYERYEDYYVEGWYIIEGRLREIELSSNGGIRAVVIRYIQTRFIAVKEAACGITPSQLVKQLEADITQELKEHYASTLSPEDLNHVGFVVYYVFASCRIFDKPPKNFVGISNAHTE